MDFSNRLITWYLQHKRELPWRNTTDPYRIWLSEIILQQTRIDQGLPYYRRFINRFPDVFALARATEDEVLKLWQGLGYYSRARNLHHTARYVVSEYGGAFPKDYKSVLALKGIGPYTAAAIVSISYGLPYAVVDGNVYRVLARSFNVDLPVNSTQGKRYFNELASDLLVKDDPATYNQAVMELGALICTPQNPKCRACPVQEGCEAYAKGQIAERPVKQKRQKVRNRYLNFMVFDYKNTYTLIEKRAARDIWRNLYQFPLIESADSSDLQEIILSLREKYEDSGLDIVYEGIRKFTETPVIHKLSHQNLIADFWHVPLNQMAPGMVEWRAIDVYAVPVLIHNFISKFKE